MSIATPRPRRPSIYDQGQYHQANASWHVEDSPWKARQVVQLLKRNAVTGSTFCEVGCGAGEILVQLAEQLPSAAQLVGYDISPQLQDFWQQRQSDRIRFHQQDFAATDENFDVVLCLDVVEHVADYLGFLQSLRGRGRSYVFNFPLEIFALKALLGHKFLHSREKFGHLHYFNKDLCLAALEETGFQVVDYRYAPGAMELAGTSTSITRGSRMLKLPRVLLSKLSVELTARTLGGYSLFVLAQ